MAGRRETSKVDTVGHEYYWNIVTALCGAILCKSIAGKNGRNEVRAVLWGLLFVLLAVVVYLCIGKKEECDSDIKQS